MPDDFDRAQEINEQHQADALAEHYRRGMRNAGLAATLCAECGDEIPQKRREAVPGCTRCIDCQTSFEIHAQGRC